MKKILILVLCFNFTFLTAEATSFKLVDNSRQGSFNFIKNFFAKNENTKEVFIENEHPKITDDTKNKEQKTDYIYEDLKTHWCSYSASGLFNKNILKGTKIGNKYYFYPDETITRGDFLMYVTALFNKNPENHKNALKKFRDKNKIPQWQKDSVNFAVRNNLIKGSEEKDGIYLNCNDKITRIEAIEILNNTVNPKEKIKLKTNYADFYLIPGYFKNSVENMTAYGLLNGYEDNTIRPYVKMTRAMASEFLWQLYKLREENESIFKNIK